MCVVCPIIVHKTTERVQPNDALSRPIFLWFVTTQEPESDDHYIFSDEDGTHWRMPRHEKV